MIFAMNIAKNVINYINKICPVVAKEIAPSKKPVQNEDEEIAAALAAAILKQNYQ